MSAPEPTAPSAGAGGEGIETYKKRAVLGAIALGLRTGLAQLIILGGTVVLARYLRPAEFGAFAMVQFVLTVLTIFGDAGLGGALIQKKTPPTEAELSSVFFAQMAMALGVLAIAWGVGELLPLIWRDLPEGAPWIVRALALNFVFTSARVVPTVLMERELHFVRISILDTVSSVAFYLFASALALFGFGVWALVLGVLAQGALGFVTALALRPWRPRLTFDREALRPLLGFGVPFQARSILALATRAAIPVVAGTMLGSESVGFLNWALETGFFALTFVDIVARVSFPLYSRLQSSPDELARALDGNLRFSIVVSFFLTTMFVSLAPALTEIIYSAQWLPAVDVLRVYALAVALGMLINVLAPALDAKGKPRVVLAQLVVVAVGVWTLAPLGAWLGETLGFALGYGAAIWIGGVFVLWAARLELPRLDTLRALGAPLVASLAVGSAGHAFVSYARTAPVLVLAVALEAVAFLALVALLDPRTRAVLLERARRKEPEPDSAGAADQLADPRDEA
jgi:O-antigen/teichoic acid export membrane protein